VAEKLGLKLVLPMVNNWPDLGGMPVYAQVYGSATEFYQNKKSQEVYWDWIKVLVTRYRNSPAIFSWQLCNEPRCPGCGTEVLHEWVKKTSEYIKSLDPHHMVTVGDEGWFGSDNGYKHEDGTTSLAYQSHDGNDFFGYMNMSSIDYGTVHLYPKTWNYPSSWGSHWIRQHADAAKKVRWWFISVDISGLTDLRAVQ
jgi:mannan endo-1,4-beta-mannosidase